jgi:hypothetical protein
MIRRRLYAASSGSNNSSAIVYGVSMIVSSGMNMWSGEIGGTWMAALR